MIPAGGADITAGLVAQLAPVTRWLHAPDTAPVQVNAVGVDLHVGEVDAARMDADGRAHPYAVIWDAPGRYDHTRLAAQVSRVVWTGTITAAGGDKTRAMWALDKIRPLLDGARLTLTAGVTGPLREVLDGSTLTKDPDADPPRWYVPTQWSTTAH